MKARKNRVKYSFSEIAKIKAKIFAKIAKELELANKNDEMDEVLDKYGVVLGEEERMPINTRTHRILVIGELAGSKKDYQMVAKKMDINPDNIEFMDYEESKRLDARRLEYSNDYSDIIYGPAPHKINEMGDTNSLLSLIEHNPMRYPRLIRSKTNSTDGRLKISISGFKEYLRKTFYYETLLEQ